MNASLSKAKRQHKHAYAGSLLAGLLLAAMGATAATPTYFWDANGSVDGPGNPPDGDWYVSTPCWTLAYDGTGPTFAYDKRANLVFAATGGAYWSDTLDYTVTVHGIAQVSDLIFQDGNCTMTTVAPFYLDKDSPYIAVLNQGQTATMNSIITSAAGTSNGLTKFSYGTLVLAATNTYRGPTTIEGGTLSLGAPQVLPRTNMLVLAGGDTRTSGYNGNYGFSTTDPTFNTGGYSQTLGPLLLTGPYTNLYHTIDFGQGASALVFADSHTQNWGGIPLYLADYKLGVDSLRFGTSSTGLTATQVGLIQFEIVNSENATVAVPAKIDANGFVTPVLPVILSVGLRNSTNAVVTWSAINGRRYLLHYKLKPNDVSWANVLQTVTAAGSTASYTNNIGTNTHQFYRVELLPVQPPA